jgi:hypothetical protein
LPQHLAERLHGNALEMSDRCRSGSIIRQRSIPCACRLGGMQTADGMVALVRINSRKFYCQDAEPQPSHEEPSQNATLDLQRSATRVLGRREKWVSCPIRRAPIASYALASAASSVGWQRGWVSRHHDVHSVGLCQHDTCPVACSDIWNWHAATAWSHTIHPPYRPRSTSATSPPHTETQRDPSRPADRVGYRPVTRVVRIHIATRSRRYVQRQPSHSWPSRRPPPSTHPLSLILERPCSSQT